MLTFRLIPLMLFFFVNLHSTAQTNTDQCIQIIVKEVNTLEKAESVDTFIRSKNGIHLTRMDRRTGLFMAVYNGELNPNPQSFLNWIEELGFTPMCFEVFEYGTGESIRKLSREDCLEENLTE